MSKLTGRFAGWAILAPLAASFTQVLLVEPPALAEVGLVTPLAQTSPQNLVQSRFYDEARELLQGQATLASRIERAMTGPDPNAVRAVDGQIVIHSGKVDRFLARHGFANRLNCGDPQVFSSDPAQNAPAAIACSIRQNSQSFAGLQPKLFARLNMLSGIAEVAALPLVSGENTVETGGIPGFKRGSLQAPARSLTSNVPDLPAPSVPILGRPVKSAIANYRAPIPPAIQAPSEVTAVLDLIQSRIETARQALPTQAARFSNPATLIAAADAHQYDVNPRERLQHQTFLREPHTGITRVLTRQDYEPDPNGLRNRLEPTVGDRYPYALLVTPTDPPLPNLTVALRDRLAPFDTQRFPFVSLDETAFRPRLALQVDGNQFNLKPQGLDYGFMVDLGQLQGIELDAISAGLEADQVNLRPDLREFFLSYRVPDQLEPLLRDRRRFLSAKAGPNNLPTLLSPQAPVELRHTYLLRTVQFDAPAALTQGQPVTPEQRRQLDKTLAMAGKDLLVVFRPIAAQPNGSYTVLWRVLGEFPVSPVTDAANYATYRPSSIGIDR